MPLVPAELLQTPDEETEHTLYCLINNIYMTGKIPDDFKESVMVMLSKKSKSIKVEEYRTLSILTHTSKILTKIILEIILGWIEKKINENLAEDQFGFWKNRGTREAILCLWNIVEKSFTVNKKVYNAFVDLLKAFDNINWNVMMKILKIIKIDYRDRRIIRKLYKHHTASVKKKKRV